MIRRTALSIIIAVVLASSAAFAEWEDLPIGLRVWYPDDWQATYDGDRMIVRSYDGAAIAMFYTYGAGTIESAQSIMREELGRIFYKMNVITPPSRVKIKGLKGLVVDGIGVIGSKEEAAQVAWVARLAVHKGKTLMVLGCVEMSRLSQYNDKVRKILSEVRAKSNIFGF